MRQDWFNEAKHEFAEAARYYFWKQPGLEEDFISEVGRVVDRITENPDLYREFDPPFRKAKTDRFPYQIVFVVIDGETVLIVAVMHQSRRPGYWKERL
jgi:toxin ParE1/3/4